MKAAVLHGQEDVRIEEMDSPALQLGEVRIRIGAALTCGTDLKVYRRGYHARMITPPAVFGHEFAGTITEIAEGVTDWKTGDRAVAANSAPCGQCSYCERHQPNLCDDLLFLNGAYAESIVVPARIVEKNLLPLSADTTFANAALTEPLACVVQGIDDCQFQSGHRILIIGSGPIGLMFAKLAQHDGCEVHLAGRGEARLQTAAQLGATTHEVHGDDVVAATSASGPFDVVIEAVGKPACWEAAVDLVRKGGTVNFFGGCPKGTAITLETERIHYSNLKLLASFHHTPTTIRKAMEHIEAGRIRSEDFVTGNCSLNELPAIFQEMAQGNRAVKTHIHTQPNTP